MTDATPTKNGEPYSTDTENVACPSCGVRQERTVMCQRYLDHPPSYYIDESCPVCEFEGVWFG